MSVNRISRHFAHNRVSGAMAVCMTTAAGSGYSAQPVANPWQAQVYELATRAARAQVANRRRFEASAEQAYPWN